QSGSPSNSDTVSAKIDRRISSRQNVYGRFSWNDQDNPTANYFPNAASPDTGFAGTRNRSTTMDDTYVLAGWVLHGNAGLAYSSNLRDSVSEGFEVTTRGLPAWLRQSAKADIFPRFDLSGYASLGGAINWIIGNRFLTAEWMGDATKLIGAHTIKTGGVY